MFYLFSDSTSLNLNKELNGINHDIFIIDRRPAAMIVILLNEIMCIIRFSWSWLNLNNQNIIKLNCIVKYLRSIDHMIMTFIMHG